MGLSKKRKESQRLFHFSWMQHGSLHDQRDASMVSAEPTEVKEKKKKKSQFHVSVCRAGFFLVVWSAPGARSLQPSEERFPGRGSCRAKGACRDL